MLSSIDIQPLDDQGLEVILQTLPLESQRAEIRWRVLCQGPNALGYLDGKPVVAGGFQLHNLGTAEPWLVLTPEARLQFKTVYRAIIQWMRTELEMWSIHRLQAVVQKGNGQGLRLIEHLGFTYEGTLRQFGADRADWDIYAWVKEH